ncbi:MAG TPA: glucokinase [Gammaproteobacteria bacterium]|nr:glucokinase [Gammaproteobacteria bacterium]
MSMRVLAGDIGGTHARLCLAEKKSGKIHIIHEQVYASQQYPDLLPIVQDFLQHHQDIHPAAACFAVAGPIRHQQARVTNLPWRLDARQLEKSLSIDRLTLLNDFQAAGYGLATLAGDQLFTLQTGRPEEEGQRALIGAGTGLGIGSLIYQDHRYVSYPSEGGHVGFAPADKVQSSLLAYLQSSLDYVCYEHLLSGAGLVRIYQFFLEEHGTASAFSESIMQAQDPAAEISHHAQLGDGELARQTLDCFVRIYGAQAGNVALNYLATGGVYLAGGIAPKIIEQLKSDHFLAAFHNKGAMSDLMQSFPVKVIMEEKVGLRGAAAFAFYSFNELRQD